MAEWLVEHGIGEERALLIEHGQAVAAQIMWPGQLTPGLVEDATLVAKAKGAVRGRVRFANGEEALVDRLDRNAAEGAAVRVEVTRPQIGEVGRIKLAQSRPTDKPCRPAPSLAEKLGAKVVRRFMHDDWEEIWSEAWDGIVNFSGGSLHFSVTPAMTLVDVDGKLPPRDLAVAACQPLGRALARFNLGGSIGVDFPTLQAKDDRKAVDVNLSTALSEWDHERTAMNGFGFVQLVARMQLPSLLHRLQGDRAGAAARLLLRRAEDVSAPGVLLLTCHPAVQASLRPEWLDELARRTGRTVRVQADPGLALAGGFAQAVAA